VPLDLFPSGLLQDIVTAKTYTPDQPGSFSGGTVDLATREFPSKWTVNFSTSTSYSLTTTGRDRLSSGGGQKRFLGLNMGIDNGSRAVPDAIKDNPNWSSDTATQRLAGLELASRQWTPTRAGTPVNGGYSLNVGGRLDLGGQRELGFVGSWTYGNTYRIMREHYVEWDGYGPSLDYYVERGVQSVLWGGLASSTLKLSDNHKLSLAGIYNQIGEDEARLATGYDVYSDQNVVETRLRLLSRKISSLQISGDHNLPWLAHSAIHWRASAAAAGRSEPGNRSNLYFLNTGANPNDTLYRWYHTGYSGANIYTDLEDHDAQFALDWTLPLWSPAARLKLGTFAESKDRGFVASRYLFDSYGRAPADGLAEDIFTPENIGTGRNQYSLQNGTFADDHYDANEHNTAFYMMSDFPVLGRLRFVGGVRYEDDLLRLNSADRSYPTSDPRSKLRIHSNTRDWLPMASVIWSMSGRANIRSVVSRTIARPEYRELSPFAFQDYALGPLTVGNPNLKTTYVMNYDLRWELYPQPGQLLAVSVFWKTFKDPIERVVSLGSSGSRNTFTFENSAAAYDRGVEIEGRKSLEFLSPALSGVTLGGNVTFVSSHVRIVQGGGTLELNRPLHGQSPYTINAVLSYTSPRAATEFSLLYNAFGDRLVSAGRWPTEPMYEKTRHQLDVTYGQKLWQGLSLKASAKNLLDAHYRVTQKQLLGEMKGKEGVVQDYRLGLTYGIGLTYSL
jgi:outer membrane receptor protein involved in Fe transport